MRWDVAGMLLLTHPSLAGWHWYGWVERWSTWGPVLVSQCGDVWYQGVLRALHACARGRLNAAPRSNYSLACKAPQRSMPLGASQQRCLVGGGRVSSWCWGRAGLFPAGGLVKSVLEAIAFWEPGNPNPLGKPGSSLGWCLVARKKEIKIPSLGNGAGVEQKQPLLSIVLPPGTCGEGDGLVHPGRWSAAPPGAFVTRYPGVQQRTDHLRGG